MLWPINIVCKPLFQERPIFILYFGSKIVITQIKTMKESIVVSMTGFVSDPQQQDYKKAMLSLNIRFAPSLSEQTKVLIVNDVTTEKYKIAKTYEVPISCVSIDWLLESCKKSKIVPTKKFQIDALFFGAHVTLLGLHHLNSTQLSQLITTHGGIANIIDNNRLLDLCKQKERARISVILTTKDNFTKLKPYLNIITFPIVDVQWVEDSLRNKFCKYPYDYALNQIYIDTKLPIDHFPKMKKNLEVQLSIDPIDKLQNKIFEQCFIYINSNVTSELAVLLKKLIMVFGGFYLDELSSAVTHILTEPVTEQEYYQLKNYGGLTYILRIDWVINCIYLKKKMLEQDFFIRSYKSKLSSTLHLEERPSNMSFNSMTFNSFGAFGMSVPLALNNRKSISVLSKVNQQNSKQKQIRLVKKLQSSIFKDYCFYIDSTQKREIQLCDLTNKILRNGGQIYTSRAQIKKGHCFYVMKDSLDAANMIQRLKKDTRGQSQIQPVSYRWVNQCLNKTQFIDITKTDSYIYKPFNFKTPILGFHKIVFQVLGLDDVTKMRLKQLYNSLGSAKNVANKAEITHCLCGKSYQQTIKYKEIKKQNQSVKFLNWKWLIECANLGKIADLQDFYLQKDNVSSTQQSQNSNLANINAIAIQHLSLQRS